MRRRVDPQAFDSVVHPSSSIVALSGVSISFCGSMRSGWLRARLVAPHTGVEASLAGIVLATRIPTRGKSYRDTRCATEICDRVNDAGTAAI